MTGKLLYRDIYRYQDMKCPRFWPYRPGLKTVNAYHFIEKYLFNIYFCDSDNRVSVSKPAACPLQCN